MLTLPADVARCRGRTWSSDEFLAPECQECKRWVAHFCGEIADGIVAHQEPPTERECPRRLPVDDSKPANGRAKGRPPAGVPLERSVMPLVEKREEL